MTSYVSRDVAEWCWYRSVDVCAAEPPRALLSESSGGRGPSSPRQLSAHSVLSTSVTLSWRPPSTSVSSSQPVIGYVVYWRQSGSRRSLNCFDSSPAFSCVTAFLYVTVCKLKKMFSWDDKNRATCEPVDPQLTNTSSRVRHHLQSVSQNVA